MTQAAPGWGSVHSPVVLVGQRLCHDCMESQKPFTGGSGRLIRASIERVVLRPAVADNLTAHAPRTLSLRGHEKPIDAFVLTRPWRGA